MTVSAAQAQPARLAARRAWSRQWYAFTRNRAAIVGLILAILITVVSVAAPLLSPFDPFDQSAVNRLKPPDAVHVLGRDGFGRDVYTRLLYAGRVSLLVGTLSVLLGGVVGTAIGLLAAYVGGRIEHLFMRFIDILMAFPSLLLGMTVLAVMGSGLRNMILAIGIVLSPAFARLIHASTLSLKRQEFIEAAQCIGASHLRIMGLHILPNALGDLVVMASIWMASAIRIEASLSFIGLGVSPPTPTWGNMIRDGTAQLMNAPWLSIFPGAAIFVAVLAFNLLGDGLRDVLDPRLQS